jgi:hypothetical protein
MGMQEMGMREKRVAAAGLALGIAGALLADTMCRSAHAFGWGATYTQVVVTSAVKLRLRDPNSAFFGPMDVFEDRRWHGKRVTAVCGSVETRGGFGSDSGQGGLMNYVFVSGHFTVYLDNLGGHAAFVRAWNALCASGYAARP